jgi:outer membrane protein assembly factor BamB
VVFVLCKNNKKEMKKCVLLFVALLTSFSAINAQYTVNKMELGRHVDGTPVVATYLNMNNTISFASYNRHFIRFSLKDNHDIYYVFDKKDLHEVTQIKGGGNIFMLDNGYFKLRNHATFYNMHGKKLYTIPINLIGVYDSLDIAIGYNHPYQYYRGELSAYRVSTGELIWKQKLPHRYHWPWSDDVTDPNQKNIIYAITDSLVRLDVVTGKTIKMPFTAGIDEPLKSRFSLVKNRDIYRDDWKEAYACIVPCISIRVLSGTHSNMIFSGDSIFIADINNIYCLDRQLNKIWVTSLPVGAGAKSKIQILGDKILLQNYGVAFQDGYIAHCGKPFIAVYDKNTGKQLSVTMPDIKNKLTDGIAVLGRAYWKDDNGLMYNNPGETEIHRIAWKAPIKKAESSDKADECFYSLVDTVYQYSDDHVKAISTDAHQVLVEANEQDVYLLKDDGTQQIFKADSIFFKDSKRIYSNNEEKHRTFLVTDGNTTKVRLIFDFKGKLREDVHDGTLYAILPTGIGVIDSKQQ